MYNTNIKLALIHKIYQLHLTSEATPANNEQLRKAHPCQSLVIYLTLKGNQSFSSKVYHEFYVTYRFQEIDNNPDL